MNFCEVYKLGRVDYQEAWDMQARLASEVAAGTRPPALLLLEHPHTYTFGRRGKEENLLWGEAEREKRGVKVHWVDRGGDITYHGPGQLVGYPIIPVGAPLMPSAYRDSEAGKSVNPNSRIPRADYVGYIRKVEKVLIKALAGLGLATGQLEGMTGVWVQPDVASRCRHCPPALKHRPSKIAAIGVKVDVHGISRHGFALNVQTDRDYWDGIIGCGLEGYPVANLAELLWEPPEMEGVVDKVVEAFGQVFGCEMVVRQGSPD